MTHIYPAGTGGFLLDAAEGAFSDATQRRIWATARLMSPCAGVFQAVPGVNNLLITFDATAVDPHALSTRLRKTWEQSTAAPVRPRAITISVDYSPAFSEDLPLVADFAGLSIEETIALHTAGAYSVAAIGATPGFAYLTGLDPRLCIPRRDTPRLMVRKGAVMIGGGHAGIVPCDTPSGWHILGQTAIEMFCAHNDQPCLLQIGDTVRFTRIA
ncbi:5-oxoprolinase subunit PxpB [Gluconacetobacter sp. 1c LMG 22058]|uniref:5-oxoprolinase subunit PxpB n=1 Tax=Gluconacetobacter dulcium TaxID=2729096 RepID=A0A7W4PGG2_9PROT|nr:5-oxoprolinase subunit PxpB [Gluconacetobacter dulcium]MBB2197122.1 5-oxoprolinase subunit PxpB [Gluconacetobacter dulcium]